jgi:hypothetical protein
MKRLFQVGRIASQYEICDANCEHQSPQTTYLHEAVEEHSFGPGFRVELFLHFTHDSAFNFLAPASCAMWMWIRTHPQK